MPRLCSTTTFAESALQARHSTESSRTSCLGRESKLVLLALPLDSSPIYRERCRSARTRKQDECVHLLCIHEVTQSWFPGFVMTDIRLRSLGEPQRVFITHSKRLK